MIRLPSIALLVLLALCTAFAAPAASPSPQDPKNVVKALQQWVKAYHRNRIDLGSRESISTTSIGRKHGALPRGMLGKLTARRELEELLAQAAAHESKETLHAVLAVAAIGGDDYRYDFRAMSHVARELGQRAVARFTGDASRTELRAIAQDGIRGSKSTGEAMQAAALRALAGFGDATADLPLMEAALSHNDADVRIGAADALGQVGAASTAPAIAQAIDTEKEGRAMEALGRAAAAILREGGGDRSGQILAHAAAGALARTTWRADEALIDTLVAARESAAVPALIAVLERFQGAGKQVRAGELSGLLQLRAHQALVDLTGAFFAADDPLRWRTWWDANHASFRVAERKPDARRDGEHTEAAFFGIPVHGTRVLFVIDLSLSMEARMPPLGTSTDDRSTWPTRLDVAREQVWEAAQKLSEDAKFDLVVFSQEARAWQGKLVRATDSTRKKLRRFLDDLEPEPYTNLWEGIRAAMEFERGSDAAANEFELDELFVLSDGAPTIGEITDPREILRVVTEANRYKRLRIHTVFLRGEGSQMDPVVAQGAMGPGALMEAIAAQNDGRFVKL